MLSQSFSRYKIHSKGPFSKLVLDHGINTLDELLSSLASLPYGRNKNRSDFNLVIKENKGTCSSKHGLLKLILDEQGIDAVLKLLMFKMSEHNTPSVKPVLKKASLSYLPEAHCYISIGNLRVDITTNSSNIDQLIHDKLEELIIEPEDIIDKKPEYHKRYMSAWQKEHCPKYNVKQLWAIREACINALN